MTDDDTQLLARAAKRCKAALTENEALKTKVAALTAENTKLRRRAANLTAARDRAETDRKLLQARLNRAYAMDAGKWEARCEVLTEENRVLRLANKSFGS